MATENPSCLSPKACAGFWIRLCSNLIDLILVVLLVVWAARLGSYLGWYFPVEITALCAVAIYALVSEAFTRQSIGKWFCGLTVMRTDGQRPSSGQMCLRAVTSKVLPLIALAAVFIAGALDRRLAGLAFLLWLVLVTGFVCCGFNQRKRAFHDWIAGTVVLRTPPPLGPWSVRLAAVGVGLALIIVLGFPSWIAIARDHHALTAQSAVSFAFEHRNPTALFEAASIDNARRRSYVDWLRTNAVSPTEYAVSKAQLHPVVVFGEFHGVKENLDFFNQLIPQVYQRVGVTTVAMEVCVAQNNAEYERLVTGRTFDHELAMKLARQAAWGDWGWKEYWDVFETVWRVNQTIPAGHKKMRLIGLDSPIDLPSFAMSIGEDQATLRKYLPVWERLRVIRVIPLLAKAEARDLQMAAQIEREIFDKREHAIVLVGQAHAHAGPQIRFRGSRENRMTAMLRQKHGAEIFSIWLHGSNTSVPGVIEATMKQGGLAASGFDLSASPLGLLRDKAAFDYEFEPRLALADMADGYVYLKPEQQLTPCTWTPGFITPAMFTANKPYYEAWGKRAGHSVNSAVEANAFFQDPKNVQ